MDKANLSSVINRRWEERGKQLDEVRKKMRIGWKNDSGILHEYFRACVINWKAYNGPKEEKVVTKLYGLYKQAVFGDCDELLMHDRHTLVGKKWAEWKKLQGMSKEQAKRRFITYLAEVDPLLIDVMPNEMPPEGFPVDNRGLQICAKCNSVVGCHRPLMDQHGTVMRRQLFEMEDLHKPENLREWVQNALANQRCIWGVHKPISKAESKAFSEWYSRDENRGFFMYDSSNVMLMIKDLVSFHYEIAYDMQNNKEEYTIDETNAQTIKVLGLSRYYTELTGETFIFEVPCTRDIEVCNTRRVADKGENHKHPVELEPPSVDYSPYENAVRLRKQCMDLGLDPHTGVQRDIEKRCAIYRERINAYFERKEKSDVAKAKNDLRHVEHAKEKQKVLSLAAKMLVKHMTNACADNDMDKMMSLSSRGCNCNVESPRGCRPLLSLMLNGATTGQVQTLIERGAHVNAVNRYGMSPLMLACRLKDIKMLHVLMKNGADEVGSEGSRGLGRTALHYCALHGSEEEVRVMTDYVLEGGEDALRVVRYLDYQDSNGESPLILAAKIRNGLMCRLFIALGANPSIRNAQKRTAAYLARGNGHRLLADWLDTKTGAGVASVETFSDMQFEKIQRYSGLQLKEMIQAFCKKFLNLLQDRATSSLLSCPSRTREYARVHGEKGVTEQSQLSNRYFLFFIMKKPNSSQTGAVLEEMRTIVREIVEHLRLGNAYPSLESPEKPLPWTPLMCACAMNDIRSIRLICHEGADPNHQNRHGTTALMLSAQLNNVDAIVELLVFGADMDVVDNEGFTAIAYATTLPLPVALSRSVINVLYNGDTEGTKRLCAEDVLKLAMQFDIEEVKARVKANYEQTSDDALRREFLHRSLLEKNGLSRIECMDDMLGQMTGLTWRVDVDFNGILPSHSDDLSDTMNFDNVFGAEEEETFMGDAYDHQAAIKAMAVQKEDEAANPTAIRCPICTLPVPCKHFFKVNSVAEYIQKKLSGKADYFTQSKADITGASKRSAVSKKSKMAKKMFDDLASNVLAEAGLNDRHTDRNYEAYIKKFGHAGKPYDRAIEWKQEPPEEDTCPDPLPLVIGDERESPLQHDVDTKSPNDMYSIQHSAIEQSLSPSTVYTSTINDIDESDARILPAPQSGNTSSPNAIEQKSDAESTLRGSSDSLTSGELSVSISESASTDDTSEFVPLPLPPFSKPTRSVLKKASNEEGSEPKKKYKANRRVIRFVVGEDEVLEGGIEDGDTVVSLSSHKKALVALELPEESPPEDAMESTNTPVDSVGTVTPIPSKENTIRTIADTSIAQVEEHLQLIGVPSKESKEGSLVLLQPEMKPSNGIKGLLTREQEKIAMTSLAHGALTEGAQQLTMRVNKNPVRVKGRTVHMFTKDPDESSESDEEECARGGKGDNWTIPSEALIPKPSEAFAIASEDGDSIGIVSISGWIFSGIYSLELSLKPIDTLKMGIVSWAESVRHVEDVLRNVWIDQLRVESLVTTQSWAIDGSKCRACAVGIVRQKSMAKFDDAALRGLCMSCMVRKTLYDRVVSVQPRSSRKRFMMEWPFHIDRFNEGGRLIQRQIETTFEMSSENEVDLAALMKQKQDEEMRQQKKPKIFIKRGDSFNLQSILRKRELDAKKAVGDDDSSVFSESTMLSSVTLATHTTATSNIGEDISLYGPRELTIIPLLLTKNDFDEVERILRVCICLPEYGGDQGVLFVAKLMQLQAEMYKMQGLEVLALGLYLDAADMIVSRLGFDSKESMHVFGAVESLFGRMGIYSAVTSYSESLKAKFQKHNSSSRKADLLISYLDERSDRLRAEKKLFQFLDDLIPNEVPTRTMWRDMFTITGPGGLRAMFLSTSSAGHLSRRLFVEYCERVDPILAAPYARFCWDTILMRGCAHLEMFQHLFKRMNTNFLSTKTAKQNASVAALFTSKISRESKDRINAFLKFGSHIGSILLDPIVNICANYLIPVFRRYVNSHYGDVWRKHELCMDVEFLHISTVLIQNKWRVHNAKRLVKEKKRVLREELLAAYLPKDSMEVDMVATAAAFPLAPEKN